MQALFIIDEHTGRRHDCIDERHRGLLADKLAAYYRWRATVERETAGAGRRHDMSHDRRDARIRGAYNRHEKAAAALTDYLRAAR
jgi:hypothetical protein